MKTPRQLSARGFIFLALSVKMRLTLLNYGVVSIVILANTGIHVLNFRPDSCLRRNDIRLFKNLCLKIKNYSKHLWHTTFHN
jgi:hypothetical protein